jgi:hypothetical protein
MRVVDADFFVYYRVNYQLAIFGIGQRENNMDT